MEIRAVGVRHDGRLYGIRSANSTIGHSFRKIIVASDQKKWWEKNLPVLQMTFHPGKINVVFEAADRDRVGIN